MIEKFGTDTSQGPPTISATGGGMALISSMFVRNAEIGQRRWGSIGADEWIQAGKWWLMKVGNCTTFPGKSSYSYADIALSE